MGELMDNSGPYDPNRKFEDFSKEFLVKYIRELMSDYLKMAEFWYLEIDKVVGHEKAAEIETRVWGDKIANVVQRRICRRGGIPHPVPTVVDALKVWQIIPDNVTSDIYKASHEIINENHVILTMTHCGTLEMYEKKMPERIQTLCQTCEVPIMKGYCKGVNPDMRCEALRLPPRNNPKDIACQWEITLPPEEPARWLAIDPDKRITGQAPF